MFPKSRDSCCVSLRHYNLYSFQKEALPKLYSRRGLLKRSTMCLNRVDFLGQSRPPIEFSRRLYCGPRSCLIIEYMGQVNRQFVVFIFMTNYSGGGGDFVLKIMKKIIAKNHAWISTTVMIIRCHTC